MIQNVREGREEREAADTLLCQVAAGCTFLQGVPRSAVLIYNGVVQVLPGGRLLAAADEAGAVSVSDLRMLGTPRKALLWQVPMLPLSSSNIDPFKVYDQCNA